MMRTTAAVLILIGPANLAANAQPPVRDAVLAPAPGYRPNDGDSAEIVAEGVPGAATRADLDAYVKARDAGDVAGMGRAARGRGVVTLARRTAVVVVKVYGPPRVRAADPRYGLSMDEYQQAMRQAIAREGDHPAGYPVEVRVTDGPHAGRTLFVERDAVGRLTWQRPAPPAGDLSVFNNPPRARGRSAPKVVPKARPAEKVPPRPVDPATRAAASVQLGKNVRFEGNRDAAAGYFRRAIREAPDSPAAAEARAILKAMGVRE